MTGEAHGRKFWRLLSAASNLAKEGWGLSMLHVARTRRIGDGTLTQAVSTKRTRSGMRVRMSFAYESPTPSRMRSFERAMQGLGVHRFRPPGGPLRSCRNLASAREVESSWKYVADGLQSGVFREPPPRPRSGFWSRTRLETLGKVIRQGGPGTWRPGYGCFRTRARRFTAAGLALQFRCEGLWNDEKDDSWSVLVESTRDVSRIEWRRLKASGFFEGLADEMRRVGLKVSMRARLYGSYVFCEFSRKVRGSGLLSAARTLLNWRPPVPFPLRPSRRPSSSLYADA